jgi:hypothetical protein
MIDLKIGSSAAPHRNVTAQRIIRVLAPFIDAALEAR